MTPRERRGPTIGYTHNGRPVVLTTRQVKCMCVRSAGDVAHRRVEARRRAARRQRAVDYAMRAMVALALACSCVAVLALLAWLWGDVR